VLYAEIRKRIKGIRREMDTGGILIELSRHGVGGQ
jgi:hypothetical protein